MCVCNEKVDLVRTLGTRVDLLGVFPVPTIAGRFKTRFIFFITQYTHTHYIFAHSEMRFQTHVLRDRNQRYFFYLIKTQLKVQQHMRNIYKHQVQQHMRNIYKHHDLNLIGKTTHL